VGPARRLRSRDWSAARGVDRALTPRPRPRRPCRHRAADVLGRRAGRVREDISFTEARTAPSARSRRPRRDSAEARHTTAVPGAPGRLRELAQLAITRVEACDPRRRDRAGAEDLRPPPHLRDVLACCWCIAVHAFAPDGDERGDDRPHLRAPGPGCGGVRAWAIGRLELEARGVWARIGHRRLSPPTWTETEKPRLSGAFQWSRRPDSNRGPLHYE
jgi:hypothetical protein